MRWHHCDDCRASEWDGDEGEMANERVMEVIPMSIHQKSPMFVGSTSAVQGLQKFLKEHKK